MENANQASTLIAQSIARLDGLANSYQDEMSIKGTISIIIDTLHEALEKLVEKV